MDVCDVTAPPSDDTTLLVLKTSKRSRRGKKVTPPSCAAKFTKTVFCRYFPDCAKGAECNYAHTEDEIRVRPNFTKTRLCSGYLDGSCDLPASECRFAHGPEDLRRVAKRDPMEEAVDPQEAPSATTEPLKDADQPSGSPKPCLGLPALSTSSIMPPPGLKVLPDSSFSWKSEPSASNPTESGASTPCSPRTGSQSCSPTPPLTPALSPAIGGQLGANVAASTWLQELAEHIVDIQGAPGGAGAEDALFTRLRF
eukprot:CAMPEP_0176038768 /NCGR_PEP_ID=MMETSP0120_2-20121206/19215_1 /TAXON_ID=160619 /ORGANISM="Kryptoperidinium foliaceum, Strain CCMP 1326" /LENGTH=253 /DNA_ID=CAMNT_0017372163 /DNA_START=73 /DNA_END=834 /DNA_ORIENTATION=+